MATLSNILGEEYFQQYLKAKFLSDEESKNDPENEPYKSKYKSREIYEQISNRLKESLVHQDNLSSAGSTEEERQAETQSEINQRSLMCLTICLDHLIAQNYMDTEELAEGEDKMTSCLKRINENNLNEVVGLKINILNHLGILWSQRSDLEKAMQFLEQADKDYHVQRQNADCSPMGLLEQIEPLDGTDDEVAHKRSQSFESIHTHTLYYLAQVYAKQEKNSLSAQYCHLTLQRQLEANDFKPVDWGLNAATLSQYYISHDKFMEARHCLASGCQIFLGSKKETSELNEEEEEHQSQREADLDRCWIKYGLALLESSRDSMLKELETRDDIGEDSAAASSEQQDHNTDKEDAASHTDDSMDSDEKKIEEKCFEPFQLEITSFEEKVTDKFVRTFDEARKIFLFIIDKINSSMTFYTLDCRAGDAIEIIQDHSKAYKLLSFFELNMKRQCIMHKRRIDMLSEVLKDLNPQYYLLVQRQLMFELAETFSTMVDLKITLIEMERVRVTPHSTQKINKLITQSIQKYQEYIDSLKGREPELPSEFPENDVRPGLVAFFCMGRLYSKYLEPDVSRRIALIGKSLECYTFLVDYCSRNPSATDLVRSEVDICKEMVELLPLKMERLKQQHSSS